MLVINKCDLNDDGRDGIKISAKDNKGIDELKRRIVDSFVNTGVDTNGDIITNSRHAQAVSKALESLKNAKCNYSSLPTECILIDLREAYFSLGAITGNTASEDIIDSIFSKFCLGK